MKRSSPVLRTAAMLALVLGLAGEVWANGEEFFIVSDGSQSVVLAYVGRVKDARTHRQIMGNPYVTITYKPADTSYPFLGDKPGHYRSPDIGALLKEYGNQLDPKNLVAFVEAEGYKSRTFDTLPRKTRGIVEMNFELEPDDSARGRAGVSSTDNSGGFRLTRTRLLVGTILGAFFIVGIGARTLGRRTSTAH